MKHFKTLEDLSRSDECENDDTEEETIDLGDSSDDEHQSFAAQYQHLTVLQVIAPVIHDEHVRLLN